MNPLTNVRNINKLNETEIKLGISGKNSWHNQYKDSAWIFIGGLPYDLTEGDIICVFSQYGEIANINLVRDKKTGKTKGFCFLCYEDQRSTILAVDNFNSTKLLGRTLRVDHVSNYKPPKEHENEDDITRKLHAEGCAPKLIQPVKQEEEGDNSVIPIKKEGKEKKKKKKKEKKKHKKEKKKNKKKARKRRSSSGSSDEGSSDSDSDSGTKKAESDAANLSRLTAAADAYPRVNTEKEDASFPASAAARERSSRGDRTQRPDPGHAPVVTSRRRSPSPDGGRSGDPVVTSRRRSRSPDGGRGGDPAVTSRRRSRSPDGGRGGDPAVTSRRRSHDEGRGGDPAVTSRRRSQSPDGGRGGDPAGTTRRRSPDGGRGGDPTVTSRRRSQSPEGGRGEERRRDRGDGGGRYDDRRNGEGRDVERRRREEGRDRHGRDRRTEGRSDRERR